MINDTEKALILDKVTTDSTLTAFRDAGNDADILLILNNPDIDALRPNRYVRFRTIADILDPIQAVQIQAAMGTARDTLLQSQDNLDKLKGLVLKNAFDWMLGQSADDGIDAGNTAVRAMVQSFIGTILTQDQANAILNYGIGKKSWSEINIGRNLSLSDISYALRGAL